MASYRFCRSDDVAALAEAYNLCYLPHAPGSAEMTVDRFRSLVRGIDLWTSSCMLARAGPTPIGVLLATKRTREALIWCVAIRPGYERQGHGRHLVTSLSQKLAILGPPRILVEVPADPTVACLFFDACGFRREARYTDLVLRDRPGPETQQASALVIPITLDELVQNGAFEREALRPWVRSAATIRALGERARGEAISSSERLEAWILYQDAESRAAEPVRRILAFDVADPARGGLWLDVLLRRAARQAPGAVVFELATVQELGMAAFADLGFESAGETVGFATEPRPA